MTYELRGKTQWEENPPSKGNLIIMLLCMCCKLAMQQFACMICYACMIFFACMLCIDHTPCMHDL